MAEFISFLLLSMRQNASSVTEFSVALENLVNKTYAVILQRD